jgi:hypothetical protein
MRIRTYLAAYLAFFSVIFMACVQPDNPYNQPTTANQNQTPTADDYHISNLEQTEGNVTAVSITPKQGKSGGDITIFYHGIGSTTYPKSTTIPTVAGTYMVTFDVEAATGFIAASGLFAGTLTITAANQNQNQTPVVADYDFGNMTQIAGNVTAVTIIPKQGKSTGAITIYYNGSTTLPTAMGTYAVTFNVAAVDGWNGATGLSAGNLIIGNPDNQTPVATDYIISGTTVTYDGSIKTVTVTAQSGKSSGAVTVKYDGNTTAPSAAGTYTITFDVAAVYGWNEASGLSAGTLTINPKVITFTIDAISAQTYTGNAIQPTVTVKDFSTTLKLNTDYTVVFTNNTNAGTATVTITGIGNYAGSSGNKSFTINKATGMSVSAPSMKTKNYNSITINTVSTPANGQTVEYAKNTLNSAPSSGWQDSTTFTGLNDNTTYYIFARSKENNNYNAGTASGGTAITTLVQLSPSDTFTINFEHINDDTTALPWNAGGNPIGNKLTLLVGQSITLTLGNFNQYSGVEWIIDGMVKSGGATFTLKDFTNFDIGTHTLTVEVWIGSMPYNRTIPLEVIGN